MLWEVANRAEINNRTDIKASNSRNPQFQDTYSSSPTHWENHNHRENHLNIETCCRWSDQIGRKTHLCLEDRKSTCEGRESRIIGSDYHWNCSGSGSAHNRGGLKIKNSRKDCRSVKNSRSVKDSWSVKDSRSGKDSWSGKDSRGGENRRGLKNSLCWEDSGSVGPCLHLKKSRNTHCTCEVDRSLKNSLSKPKANINNNRKDRRSSDLKNNLNPYRKNNIYRGASLEDNWSWNIKNSWDSCREDNISIKNNLNSNWKGSGKGCWNSSGKNCVYREDRWKTSWD